MYSFIDQIQYFIHLCACQILDTGSVYMSPAMIFFSNIIDSDRFRAQ